VTGWRGAARRRLVVAGGGGGGGGPRGRRLPRFNFSRSAPGKPNERAARSGREPVGGRSPFRATIFEPLTERQEQ